MPVSNDDPRTPMEDQSAVPGAMLLYAGLTGSSFVILLWVVSEVCR